MAPILQSPDAPCGPACLASVAAYWDRPVSAERLRECLGARADQGAHSAEDLAGAARGMGMRAYVFQGALDDLDANLERGRPVIVLLRRRPLGELGELGMGGSLPERLASGLAPKKHHWVVVMGSDRGGVVIHDPALGPLRVDRRAFDGWWSEMARLSLLVEPAPGASAPLALEGP